MDLTGQRLEIAVVSPTANLSVAISCITSVQRPFHFSVERSGADKQRRTVFSHCITEGRSSRPHYRDRGTKNGID